MLSITGVEIQIFEAHVEKIFNLHCTKHTWLVHVFKYQLCQVGIMLMELFSFYKKITYWNILFHSCSKMEGFKASSWKARDRHPGKRYITLWCRWRTCTGIYLVQRWQQDHFLHVRFELACMHLSTIFLVLMFCSRKFSYPA